ncbi:MAG: response regulator transcription factor [Candidatus Melainabacteria bacterium]|nr:response regulator transcription factor [Candidatus Melainabacteria bacterium]
METALQHQGYLYTFSKSSFRYHPPRTSKLNTYNPKKEMILILIADDHPYLIQGVEVDLNKDRRIKIIGTAHSYGELMDKVAGLQPDMVLLDLKMPDCEEYDLKPYIHKLRALAKCKVIIFSNETGWARIHRCLEIGASAYIEKAISIGKLANLIRHVYESDELVIFTAEHLPEVQFSPRQRETLHYMVDGKENDEIAELLDVETKTVQSYVNEIKDKLAKAFYMYPVKPRTLIRLASKLGFGHKLR